MSRHDSGRRRFEPPRRRDSWFPPPVRVILGSMAIAAIVLALVVKPGQDTSDTSRAAPEPRPTFAAAAAVSLPTVAAATPVSVPASSERIHVVASGDTLSSMAKKYYGDASKWQKILDANKDVLKSAESLQVAQKLKIPE